jgi:hypothetical protein
MDPQRFDTLTRSLGQVRSRRGLLTTLGGAALGALGLAGASRVDAASGGTSACAAFCQTVFPPGPQRGQCVRDAAQGDPRSLCAQCGANPSSYCHGTCCPRDETCWAGSCVPTAEMCGSGASAFFCPGTCCLGATATCCDPGLTDCVAGSCVQLG